MKFLRLTIALALALSLAAFPAEAQEPHAETSHNGIDVSHYSGEVDWRQVEAAGYGFAFVKATEGVDSPDPHFESHWAELAETGLARGAYHFYVTEDDPEEQARFFISKVELLPGDLRPAVDVEILGHGTEPGLADRLRRFLELVEGHYGVKPIIYTSPKFWNAHVGEGFGGYPLWVAEYGVEEPTVPEGWERWTIWQWRDSHEIPGIEKDADLSRLHPELAGVESLRLGGDPSADVLKD